MKDQRALLNKCILNDVPVIVISGNDKLAVPVLLKYLDEAEKAGCNIEFIDDFVEVVEEFIAYQSEEPYVIKLPD